MSVLLDFEKWFQRVSSLEIFNSSEISRKQYLISVLILFGFTLSNPFVEWHKIYDYKIHLFAKYFQFLALIIFPIIVQKRVRSVFNENVKFNLLGFRALRMEFDRSGITYLVSFLIFFFIFTHTYKYGLNDSSALSMINFITVLIRNNSASIHFLFEIGKISNLLGWLLIAFLFIASANTKEHK